MTDKQSKTQIDVRYNLNLLFELQYIFKKNFLLLVLSYFLNAVEFS